MKYSNLKKYTVLTTIDCSKDTKNINFLEGTLYLNNALKFIKLLEKLDINGIKYKVTSGFKSKEVFEDQSNNFNTINIELIDSEYKDLNKLISKDIFKINILDDKIINIQLMT